MSKKIYLLEMVVGIIAMISGLWLSILVFQEGYYLGAWMLVVTGFLSILLGIKEYRGVKSPLWQETFFKILRRTMLFLNLMLSVICSGTLFSLL